MPKVNAAVTTENVVASATLNQKIDLNAVLKLTRRRLPSPTVPWTRVQTEKT